MAQRETVAMDEISYFIQGRLNKMKHRRLVSLCATFSEIFPHKVTGAGHNCTNKQ